MVDFMNGKKKVCHMKPFFLMHATIAMDHAIARIRIIKKSK
jgi:hypothetical protein